MKTSTEKSSTALASAVAEGAHYSAVIPPRSRPPAAQIPRTVSAVPGVSKILVPFDFSAGARLALRYAALLAQPLGAKITLVYVDPIPFLAAGLRSNPLVLPDGETDASITRELAELVALQIGAAFPVEIVVRRGQAGVEIVEAARALGSDLIVMPTHGYTGLKRTLFGGTADHVVRHAPCPVCTIRHEVAAQAAEATGTRQRWRHILVPVDFSECSRQAVRFAGMLAKQTGGRLTLFHGVGLSEAHASVALLYVRQAQAHLRLDAEQKLQAWIKREVPASVPVKALVRVSAPPLELIGRGIRLRDSDLIIMGTHEYSWMRRVFQGGSTERMMRHAPCAVISVRPACHAPAALNRLEHGATP